MAQGRGPIHGYSPSRIINNYENITSAEEALSFVENRQQHPQNIMDLKHINPSSVLTSPSKSHRQLQHPRNADQRLGSPTSIPSSPTSVRSSSSAIFERDIEPIVSPSPPSAHHHQVNPHRIPRAKTTEQLEQSVPSVLDSAATILIGMGRDDLANEIAVVSPAASILEVFERGSGFASPIGSLRSRSPSPVGSRAGAASPKAEILLNIPVLPQTPAIVPSSILGLQNMSPPLPPLSPNARIQGPSIQTTVPATHPNTTDTNITDSSPSVNYLVANSTPSSRQPSPTRSTLEQSPTFIPGDKSPPQPLATNVLSPVIVSSHPPSPPRLPKKRLSFMSYNDLLSSAPTTTQSLSSLTTCASAADPPPHIPCVSGLNVISAVHSSGCTSPGSHAPSLRNFILGGQPGAGKRDSITLLDNMGGEWEREGLGKGLEERLDSLVLPGPQPTIPIGGTA